MLTREEACAQLRSVGLRATEPRIAILSHLVGNKTHPTVAQIHAHVQALLPKLPEITVYRTLDALMRNKLLVGVHGSNQGWRFDPDTSPHAHAVCHECGEVWDVMKEVRAVLGPMPEGFDAVYTEVAVIGTCQKCRDNASTSIAVA